MDIYKGLSEKSHERSAKTNSRNRSYFKNIITEMNIISIIGCIIVLTSFFIPWFTLSYYTSEYRYRINFYPLFLRVEAYDRLAKLLHDRQLTFQLNLGATFLGALSIFGSIMGFIGGILKKGKISGIGGLISIISVASFISILPGNYINLKANWGGLSSAIGSIFMLTSTIISINTQSILSFIKQIASTESIDKPPIKWTKLAGITLELLAIIGSIYCSYELSRLIYSTLAHGTITLNFEKHPFWVYQLEIFLCMYTIVYWYSRFIWEIFRYFFPYTRKQ